MDNGFVPKENLEQSKSRLLQIAFQVIGALITVAALAFAVQKAWKFGQSNLDRLLHPQVLTFTLLGGIFYGFAELFLAQAWQRLLIWFGETAKTRVAVAVYGRTQIAKYIPGNVFHLPSRHLLGYQAGFKHPALVGAAIYEIIGLVISAGLIALIGFFSQETLIGRSILWPLTIIFLFILIPLVTQIIVSRFKIAQKLGFPDRSVLEGLKGLLPVLAIYLIFFALAGCILWGIVGVTTGMWFALPVPIILSTFAISWLTGFITPGAPAGIGVREATMILILSSFIGEPASVLVAIILRLVVTIGDLAFFGISHLHKLETTYESNYQKQPTGQLK
jgi:uncharacterized membrane protein YbhN (UPF0104 family)